MTQHPEHLRKSLRLFLSVDIAGSTAFKALQPERVQPWLPALYQFFREFPVRLASAYSDADPPRLWKTLGDEMVFVAEIQNHRDLSKHLCRFRDAISGYREIIKDASRRLDLKGAAWLAGFPVGNTIIRLPQGIDQSTEIEDYVGPSVDCGFRLAKHATPHRLVLSIEAAYILAASAAPGRTQKPEIYIEKGEELKGVLEGRPYPCLWIGVPYRANEEFHKLEAELLSTPPSKKESEIRDYCRLFIEEYGTPLFLPFIDGDEDFCEPPDFNERMAEIAEVWKDRCLPLDGPPSKSKQVQSIDDVEKQISKLRAPSKRRPKVSQRVKKSGAR